MSDLNELAAGLFPNGTRAAVSLTYDDALHVHLDAAMPDLEANGLRGTFYTPTRGAADGAWQTREADWAAAAKRGHEIGNHTQLHPCSIRHEHMRKHPNKSLETYNLGRIEAELVGADRDIDAVAGKAVRTFAYTCGDDFVGVEKTSFRPLVQRLFPAARGVGNTSADPMAVDLNFVPCFGVVETIPTRRLLERVDQAIAAGHWAVFCFHGVGGGHPLNVKRDAHLALCEYVASKRNDLWCDTFVNVALRIRAARRQPWPTK
jgi:peptidoglycan/xylan/chitin deacetylase (PgdA/CDA1 family)